MLSSLVLLGLGAWRIWDSNKLHLFCSLVTFVLVFGNFSRKMHGFQLTIFVILSRHSSPAPRLGEGCRQQGLSFCTKLCETSCRVLSSLWIRIRIRVRSKCSSSLGISWTNGWWNIMEIHAGCLWEILSLRWTDEINEMKFPQLTSGYKARKRPSLEERNGDSEIVVLFLQELGSSSDGKKVNDGTFSLL